MNTQNIEYNITGHTVLTGLLGSPVSHSVSPAMHNLAFRMLGLDYVYLCFDVGTDHLKEVTDAMKLMGVRGFNCTMPDKNLMCELCDELSPAAQLIGAVNTVLVEDGRLIGHNTDGIGYMQAVKDAGFDIIGKSMTLLGAGGAATSIAVQAALDGVKSINIFSIRDQFFGRAERLAESLTATTGCRVMLYDMADQEALKKSIAESEILTNATSVGMAPNTDRCLIPEASWLRKDLIVSDVIYNPRETKLLSLAKSAGCRTCNGMYMLLYQGAAAFKIWTGRDMPTEAVKEKYFV
ncbi:MAG: shikimate dehydrogenase [Lachnospiraceae bacterium]|nr:shikimate dehydrogenase [Lachnospiraceae bacterium]